MYTKNVPIYWREKSINATFRIELKPTIYLYLGDTLMMCAHARVFSDINHKIEHLASQLGSPPIYNSIYSTFPN